MRVFQCQEFFYLAMVQRYKSFYVHNIVFFCYDVAVLQYAIMLILIMLIVIMLNVTMHNVIILNVRMLSCQL